MPTVRAILCGAVIGLALALPAPRNASLELSISVTNAQSSFIDPNTSYCWVTAKGCCIQSFNVLIGVPYNQGSGCNGVYYALKSKLYWLTSWQCVEDAGPENTRLYFNLLQTGADWVDIELARMYPMVNYFLCNDKIGKRDSLAPVMPPHRPLIESSGAGKSGTEQSSTAQSAAMIDPNTSQCWTTKEGTLIQQVNVLIGVPYNDASGCNDVYHALEDAMHAISSWQCVNDAGPENTRLYFNLNLAADTAIVNTALQSMYPMVNGFDCPNALYSDNNNGVKARDLPPPNTAACYTSGRGIGIETYHVFIAVPYNNGVGCDDVFYALAYSSADITAWGCQDNGRGDTEIYFNAFVCKAYLVNEVLGYMYPMVDVFNCHETHAICY